MAGKRVESPIGVVLVATVLAALVAALVLSFLLEDGEPGAQPPVLTLEGGGGSTPELQGEPAPEFSFAGLAGDEEASFRAFRDGRPAVVNFFAERCVPCVLEMPTLEEAHREYGDRVAFLGLSERESVEDALALVERTGVSYEIGRDPAGDIITAFAGFGLPTTVFIAADGTITTAYTREIEPEELEAELEALLV